MATKQEVFKEHLSKYLKAPKQEKTIILNGLSQALGMHRKSVIRALKREQLKNPLRRKKKAGRPSLYTPDVVAALKEVREIAGAICAERLHGIVGEYVRILQRDQMWHHGKTTTEKLLRMSEGTMKNRIGRFVRIKAGGGRGTTKPSDLKEIIPIRRGPWEHPLPGFGEIDTVVHCGYTLSGDMAYTVNFTDIATMWTESAGQLNKGQKRTCESIAKIKRRLPFPLRGLDPDSGSEFVNWHLKAWCDEKGVELTRSRPNHKNDNAHIEQKNYTGVRKFLGYGRIDKEEAIALMNELYAGPLRLYLNFFQPSMKCAEKVRIGSRYVRKYDAPKTPYQRVLEHPAIDEAVKEQLRRQYAILNPLLLRREIDHLIDKIFKIQRLR